MLSKRNYDYCGGNNSCFRNSGRINCSDKLKRKVIFKDEIVGRGTTSEDYKEVKVPLHLNPYPMGGIIRDSSPDWLQLSSFPKTKNSGNLGKDFRRKKKEEIDDVPSCAQALQVLTVSDVFRNDKYMPGYGHEKEPHPFYTTTSMEYGYCPQTERGHMMTLSRLQPRKNYFNSQMANTLYRNRSLNVSLQ